MEKPSHSGKKRHQTVPEAVKRSRNNKSRIAIWPNLKHYALTVRQKYMFTVNGQVNRPSVHPVMKRSLFRSLRITLLMQCRALQHVRHAVQLKLSLRKYPTGANATVLSAAASFSICRIYLSSERKNIRRIKTEIPVLPVLTADGIMCLNTLRITV